MMLREKMIPCQSREAIVTVLSYHNGIMDGWLLHPRLEKSEKIQSLSQLMMTLNSLLDLEDCPGQPCPASGASRRCEEGRDIPNSDLVSGTLYMAGQADLAGRESGDGIPQRHRADSAAG